MIGQLKITISFIVLFCLPFFYSCKKNEKKLPLITTSSCEIGIVNAQITGVLYDEGDSKVTEKGICWGLQEDLSISNNKVVSASQEQNFKVEISGLDYDKNYFARAYAINSFGVSYGKVVSFKTSSNNLPSLSLSLPSLPKINSAEILLQLNQQTKATFTAGICWSTNAMPTVLNDTSLITLRNHSNTVPFINSYQKSLQNLTENTCYYVRAFCTNGLSMLYSSQITFTTAKTPNPLNINLTSLNALGTNSASVSYSLSNITINISDIVAVGVCWSENQMPTNNDYKKEQAYSGTSYSSLLDQLNPNTDYYLRAYVITNLKTIYSSQKMIRTYNDKIVDVDGNSYYTVMIGNQEWMAGNLRTSRFNNGTTLQYVANYNQWVNSVNSQVSVYCYYGDQSSNNPKYGKLYPDYVARASNIAPVGWHVATAADWQTLFANNALIDLWDAPLSFDSNITRLSLSAGGQWENGYSDLGLKGYFWTSDPRVGLTYPSSAVVTSSSSIIMGNHPGNGYSIRCVKN